MITSLWGIKKVKITHDLKYMYTKLVFTRLVILLGGSFVQFYTRSRRYYVS